MKKAIVNAVTVIAAIISTITFAADLRFEGTIADIEIGTLSLDKAQTEKLLKELREHEVKKKDLTEGHQKFLRGVEEYTKMLPILKVSAFVSADTEEGDIGVVLQKAPTGDGTPKAKAEIEKAKKDADAAYVGMMKELFKDKDRVDSEVSLFLNTVRRKMVITVMPDGTSWCCWSCVADPNERM